MTQHDPESLWRLLDARDISLRRSSFQLMEKEAVIGFQAAALGEKNNAIQSYSKLVLDLQSLIVLKDQAIAEDQLALAQKERMLAEMQLALAKKERSLAEMQDVLRKFEGAYDLQSLMKSESLELEKKEAVIQRQASMIKFYRTAHFLLSPKLTLVRIARNLKERIAPRLGNLNQHSPNPLRYIAAFQSKLSANELPKISLITPSFQQGHFIERTIQSVIDQSYPKLEYIVQDGGSSDNTVAVLKKHADKIAYWESHPDTGQSQAINLGFAHSTGEIMGWLNSDDILLPGALAYVAEYFARHPEVDVVYGNRILIDENDMQIGRWILPGHNGKVLSWADYVPQETLFWRRSIWEKVGGRIDETFRFAMDWDLIIRFRNAGATFAHIPRFLGAFRIHSHQKTSAAISDVGYAEMDRIRERELGRKVTHGEIRKAVSAFMLHHIVSDAVYRLGRAIGISRQ